MDPYLVIIIDGFNEFCGQKSWLGKTVFDELGF